MKCPVCDNIVSSMVCGCGYDASRDYEKYPAFGILPAGTVSVSGLRDQRQNLLRCAGCGNHGFSMKMDTGLFACIRCGRPLTAEELLPLRQAMGWEKPAAPEVKSVAPLVNALSQVAEKKRKTDRLDRVLSQNAGKSHAEKAEQDGKRIVSVVAGGEHTVALYDDGTVAAVGENREGQCNVLSWRNVVAISARHNHTIGLCKDGTVLVAGSSWGDRNVAIREWNDIAAVADGTFHTVGLKKNGTVVSSGDASKGKRDLQAWFGIRKIAAGNTHTVGLREDGNIMIAGKGKGTKFLGIRLGEITDIAVGDEFTVALRSDGTVAAAGNNSQVVERWTDISTIAAGEFHVVALRKDGTAAATGHNFDGRCNVDDWNDLAGVAAGHYHTVGLKKDGTLVAVGANKKGQCDVEMLVRR